jgi:hypothetical protein
MREDNLTARSRPPPIERERAIYSLFARISASARQNGKIHIETLGVRGYEVAGAKKNVQWHCGFASSLSADVTAKFRQKVSRSC